jgi:hypothetical protein
MSGWTACCGLIFAAFCAPASMAQFAIPRINPKPIVVRLHVIVLRERQALPLHEASAELALFQPLRIRLANRGEVDEIEVRPLSLERRRWLRLEVTDETGQRRATRIRLRGTSKRREGEIEAPLAAPGLRLHLWAEVRS